MTGQQHAELNIQDVLELLTYGDLQVEGQLPYSSNYTLLTTAEYKGLRALTVYKPCRGERPLWDFPRGTLYQREVAAFLVSEALNFSLVPATIVRHGPYGVGSLQLFVHHDQEAHLFTMQREGGFEDAILRLAAFDYLINNADRKSGHCLKGLDNRLWAIDHGISFHHEYKLRTVLWDFVGQPFSSNVLDALVRFQQAIKANAPLKQTLDEMLSPMEMKALRRRLNHMVSTGTYPEPGSGPNIPWPPV